MLLDPLVADIGDDTGRVNAPAPDIQGMLIDIGGKQLQVDLKLFKLDAFEQQHCQGVDFLTGRAGRGPHPQLPLVLVKPLLVEKYREHFLGQGLERFTVAEEVGHADQHVLEQQLGFLGGGPQVSQVTVEVGDGVDLQAALDAAAHGCALVLVEVVPGA
ncbi:hypothetical protein D3C80_884350 [compost metagenome]